MYTATKKSDGNYEVFFNGTRVSTGSSAILGNYGLSPTQLSSGVAQTAIGQTSSPNAYSAPPPPPQGYKPSIPENVYQVLTNQVQNGQITSQEALRQIQGYVSSGQYSDTSVNTQKLFPPGLSFTTPDGTTKQFDSTGSGNIITLKKVGSAFVPDTSVPSSNVPTSSVPSGSTTPPATSGSPVPAPEVATLPPEFQQLYTQLETYLQQLTQRGQVLNPDVNITPEQTLAFLNQAQTEINPYYAGQLKLAKDSLSKTLNYAIGNEQQSEQQAQRDYSTNLRTLGETAADRGFAQSGLRQRDEGNLAYDTQTSIDNARKALSYNSGNAASTFAQQYGSDNLPNPTIGQAPRVLAGQPNFQTGGGSNPLYQLSPDVYSGLKGSSQYQQQADISNRASQLESAFRTTQGVNQARQLIL